MQQLWLCIRSSWLFEDTFDMVTQSYTNAISVTIHHIGKGTWLIIWKHIIGKSCKCNQCGYSTSRAYHLRSQWKMHSGENSKKCNYASSWAGNLRMHLKTYSAEKSNRCDWCNYACPHASSLRKHFKPTLEKSQTNATNVIMHPLVEAL